MIYSTRFPESDYVYEYISDEEYLLLASSDSGHIDIRRELCYPNEQQSNSENSILLTEEERLGLQI